ncbi:MAG: hypothetical protein ABF301_05825 [Sulfurovum sp.]|jgi:hypothetical protein|nr:MAG: Uncharacterised protein [Arcobacter lacus]
MHEKQKRIRYIRVVEKFFTRTVSLLKMPEFNHEKFIERTLKNYEDMNRVDKVDLHSNYYNMLHAFINQLLMYVKNHSKDFEDEKSNLLKEANIIQKEKKKSAYSKDKHKKNKFDDGY